MTTAAQLTGATPAQVAAARATLAGYIQGLYPTLAVQVGQLADLVLNPAADALAGVEVRATAAAISLNPYTALAAGGYDPTILNAALAGLGVTRLPAAAAAGTAAFVFSNNVTRSVPTGFQLQTTDGTLFKTASAVRFLIVGQAPQNPGDVTLVANPAGGFVGTVPVTAAVTGTAGNRAAGTTLTAVNPLPSQTGAYAATNIAGGANAETDAALLARLPAATAPLTTASDLGAQNVVTEAATFSGVTVFGFGDAGMTRGRSVLSLQSPGRTDVRVRVAASPGRLAVPVTATLVAIGAHGTWQFTLPADASPGWFVVEKVTQTTAPITDPGYPPTSTVFGFDLTADSDPPAITIPADAAFSIYATAVVQFVDTATSTSGLTVGVSTRPYLAVTRYVPGISAAQTAVESATVRAAGGDCLVRAAVPVLVSVAASVTPASGVVITAAQAAAAVAQAVNNVGLSATLQGAQVAAAALGLLPAGTSVQLSGWAGTLYRTDGATTALTGTNGLAATTDWTGGVGEGGVAYYTDATSITATVA